MSTIPNWIIYSFRALLALAFLIFTYLMLSKPTGDVHGLINDKLAHGLGFFVLAFVFEGAFPRTNWWWKALILIGYGFAIELVQLNLSYRHFSWLDWCADIAGVLLFIPCIKPTHWVFQRIGVLFKG